MITRKPCRRAGACLERDPFAQRRCADVTER
jgi:hypothetical protein